MTEEQVDRQFIELDCVHEAVFILAACNFARCIHTDGIFVPIEALKEFTSVVMMLQQVHDGKVINSVAAKVGSIIEDGNPFIDMLKDVINEDPDKFKAFIAKLLEAPDV